MEEASGSRKREHGGQLARPKQTWSDLSAVALQKIYKFVQRKDECSMAMVCRSWSLQFPCRYEYFKFALTESMLKEGDQSMVDLANKFGHMFKVLRIKYTQIGRPDLILCWISHLTSFMWSLNGKAQLRSLEIRHLTQCYTALGEELKRDNIDADESEYQEENHSVSELFDAFSEFLTSVNSLEEFTLKNCLFPYLDYIDFLYRIFKNHKKITRIILSAVLLCKPKDPIHEKSQALSWLLTLPLLKVLEINYHLILGENANPEGVLEILKNHGRELDVTITLLSCNCMKRFKKFTTQQWNSLKVNPKVQVKVKCHSTSSHWEDAKPFLVRGLPLERLLFKFESCNLGLEEVINPLLKLKYDESLLQVGLDFMEGIPDLISKLVSIPKFFPNVYRLKITLWYPVEDLSAFEKAVKKNLHPFFVSSTQYSDCEVDGGTPNVMLYYSGRKM